MAIVRKLDIRPESVETIYNYYTSKILLVNRKYQRKLVWTIKEKEKFIDSISKDLPIPLILVATTKYKENTVYEIIDGMQRLNAIISFIENEIHLNGKYFNLETLAITRSKMKKGRLTQRKPMLTEDECLQILSYQLPFSISAYDKESDIEEIFRRINSYGKTLSDHELRQAGSMGTFNEIIRSLAETIRGDVSPSDKLLLGNMRKISINNKGLEYGINLKDVFWHKHYILTENNIRASRDEELIAHLVLAMLLDCDVNIGPTALNKAYGLSDEESDNMDTEALIKRYGGAEFIKNQFLAVFQEINRVLNENKTIFADLVYESNRKYLNHTFQVIFLAFHKLLVKEEMKIINYQKLNAAIQHIGDSCVTPHVERIRHKDFRNKAIKSAVGIIREHFTKRDEKDPVLSNGVIKLESLINAAKTENNSYDFKQGLHQLDKEHKDIKDKILKTLCSFVNLGKNSVGYVVIGIADKEDSAKAFKDYYNADVIKKGDFWITGIDEEAKKYKSMDDYRTKLEQHIKTADIEPKYYATQIVQNMDMFTYEGKSIIIFRVQSKDDPVKFKGKFYQRRGTSSDPVLVSEERQIWELFISKS